MEDRSKELAIIKKAQKEFPSFTDLVDSMGSEDLKSNLCKYADYREQTQLAMAKDEELKMSQEKVKELKAPYSETISALKLKLSYIHVLLADKTE